MLITFLDSLGSLNQSMDSRTSSFGNGTDSIPRSLICLKTDKDPSKRTSSVVMRVACSRSLAMCSSIFFILVEMENIFYIKFIDFKY